MHTEAGSFHKIDDWDLNLCFTDATTIDRVYETVLAELIADK